MTFALTLTLSPKAREQQAGSLFFRKSIRQSLTLDFA